MFNYGSMTEQEKQGQNNNTLLRNQQQDSHSNSIMQTMETVWKALQQPQLHQSIMYIGVQMKEVESQMLMCTKSNEVTKLDEQFMREVKQNCLRIKRTNQQILIQIMNLKAKMSINTHASHQRDNSLESEYNIVQEKIRRKKLQIANKLQEIKSRQLLKITTGTENQRFNKSRNCEQKQVNLNIVLTELKDAAEIVNKQLIGQREQIRELVRDIYQTEI